MGSKLSCISKQKNSQKAQKNAASPNHTKPKQQQNGDTEYAVTEKVKLSASLPVANGKPTAVGKVKSEDLEQMVPMDSAPSNYHLPTPFKPLSQINKLAIPPESELVSKNESGPRKHKNQPVNLDARQLARGTQRPSNWKDLYWNLIERPQLKTDEDKVRAIFTWLCSLDPSRVVFPLQYKKDKELKSLPQLDCPERVLNALMDGRSSYFQAFQTLCNQAGIESHVVRGIAKGVAYEVGQRLLSDDPGAPIIDPKTQELQPQLADLEHAWNVCKIDGNWRLFDPAWAAKRLAVGPVDENEENKENKPVKKNIYVQATEAVSTQYQTDMFYFMVDPSRLIFTHFPAERRWQLLQSPATLKKFQDCVFLKPSFFRYGLGLYSHPEGYIPVKNELTLKFLLPENEPEKLLFTYNLNLEGLGQIYQGKNLTTYGMHTISIREKMVTFKFRFPKQGIYKLLIYSKKTDETLFADVCEYRVHALYNMDEPKKAEGAKSSESTECKILPFPPCNQSSYGPTAKATLYGLQTLPVNLDPIVKASGGFVEIRFCQLDSDQALPKLTARLKSHQWKESDLNNCILYRQVEASRTTTGASSMWTTFSGQGACVPTNVVTAYLPNIGEYALEIFARPAEANEEDSYHLVWQFLITAEECWNLSEKIQERLAMIELGAREPQWSKLGFRTYSHPDPLIRVPTVAGSAAHLKKRNRTERELLSEFAATHSSVSSSMARVGGGYLSDSSNMGSQITVIDRSLEHDSDHGERSNMVSPTSITNRTLSPVEEAQAEVRPRDCDFNLVLEVKEKRKIMLLAQMVDISTQNEDEEEKDVTNYVFREPEDEDERIHREELEGNLSDSSLVNGGLNISRYQDRINYLIRVPKGGRFYKLFFYACAQDIDADEQIPLVFTYLIEAPARLTSSETPYIGSLAGPFPEKTQNSHTVSLRT